jgi:hypothetical protein
MHKNRRTTDQHPALDRRIGHILPPQPQPDQQKRRPGQHGVEAVVKQVAQHPARRPEVDVVQRLEVPARLIIEGQEQRHKSGHEAHRQPPQPTVRDGNNQRANRDIHPVEMQNVRRPDRGIEQAHHKQEQRALPQRHAHTPQRRRIAAFPRSTGKQRQAHPRQNHKSRRRAAFQQTRQTRQPCRCAARPHHNLEVHNDHAQHGQCAGHIIAHNAP